MASDTSKPARAGLWRSLVAAGLCLCALALVSARLMADDATVWEPLIKRLREDGISRSYLDSLFNREEVVFDPRLMARKMVTLIRIKSAPKQPEKSASAPAKPAPARVYPQYLQSSQLENAYQFMEENRTLLREVEDKTGVPREILVGILLVETKLGSYMGTDNAFNTLASMALCEDFRRVQPYLPMNELSHDMQQWVVRRTRQKADWAYEELLAFLEYAQSSGQDPLTIPGSPYGAIGMCQFMPTNAVRFGVDGDGDGKVDLFTPHDALYSIANYLNYHGWRKGLSRSRKKRVLYHYNHSDIYTETVVVLSEKLALMRRR